MEPILTCQGLTKQYGNMPALMNASFNLYAGRIIGLLGPNGSGKTTFIKMAAGLLHPSGGTLTIGGHEVGVETKKIVSYLPDRDYLPDYMKVSDIIKMFSEFYSDFDSVKALDMLSRLGIDLTKKFSHLSKGMREKIQLSLVMSRQAKLYLLDEPIAGVDPAARDYILNTILQNYNREAAVVISTHLIYDIEQVLDDVLMLQNGTVFLYDSAENIRTQTGQSIDMYFREVYRC
ncbi:ABC-2 type transport system ATP-binding protein [Ruminococcus sp. YE71]|uniref:ABC transporter ATP-binding protein n=1 Tax=unclassified Ruminococcus TaxID=2608920 RepID=UPI00088D7D4A|nr:MULTISPECIES: ABC transporter ATP-binding protein [unclassified Ruminococcus]SDA27818.1 ABC-2 type transport system ATP-binding protein [Ruminococcus sp. YE78]SFW46280.1 ABC-2 type transport system ATP-binding protein [Ruminococcus sp. YE71]